MYEDDGISDKYLDGECLKTEITYRNCDREITVTIAPYGKGFRGMPRGRDYRIELMQTKAEPQDSNAEVCQVHGSTVVQLKNCDITKTVTVKLKQCI